MSKQQGLAKELTKLCEQTIVTARFYPKYKLGVGSVSHGHDQPDPNHGMGQGSGNGTVTCGNQSDDTTAVQKEECPAFPLIGPITKIKIETGPTAFADDTNSMNVLKDQNLPQTLNHTQKQMQT